MRNFYKHTWLKNAGKKILRNVIFSPHPHNDGEHRPWGLVRKLGGAQFLLACFITVWGCNKKATDFRSFLQGTEITYPGKITNPGFLPGNGRVMLIWNPSPDPSIKKYTIYWNNNADSLVVNAVSHKPADTINCIINNLSEYAYSFFIYSYDGDGNRSVLTELDNIPVYGPIYRSGLHNRPPNASNSSVVNADGSATLNFLAPIDTINITTRIRYVNTSGDTVLSYLAPAASSATLPNYKASTKVLYQSSFIPKQRAIDTFLTNAYDTFPPVYTYVLCDKSTFAAVNLPQDMQPYDASSTYLAQLWNGNMQPRDYPNIFHSNGGGYPGAFTFDMGKVYDNLGRIEETGRTCCHNPTDFEVWGITDTTGAISALAPNDGNWKSDVTAKGWTLLKEVIRTDDGVAPFDSDLGNTPPPVRFIIIRVLATANNSGYVNMSQLTFWNRQ